MNELVVKDFLAYTIGMLVLFGGINLTRRIRILREFNIPEPVTGGLLAAIALFAIFLTTDLEVTFDLSTRDRLRPRQRR